ncbi:argininosuccinate lyase [Arthroderma uncinatum]|uniref:argininosuccinate lyase n=1 Tax=Arthroderma uncinatum TaxID=74035 RepID=UPI00144AB32E|nr:argininosuccinate lyase [Arthroderma uncinatum]KAF3482909.1 argininosuccinate lyase [Arthroderma uncinatum]
MAEAQKATKLWGGRFSGELDPLMVTYNESINFDKVFYAQDIKGSIAFARANVGTGILTKEEFAAIEKGLTQVLQEWKDGKFVIQHGIDEDIHTANERRGRSRNDQVATDLRMWLRDELREAEKFLVELLTILTDRAALDIDYLMPGYTHLQRGQPVRWSHWMLSYGSAFLGDLERLREVIKHVNKSPLGCGALAGNAFGIDRVAMAEELGFEGLIQNSMAGVGDRDFILEALQWASTLMLHMSRWSEDLIIYSTTEFGFVRLSDAYTTGSSLMPQKKNCDSLELLRGKSARLFGAMAGLTMTIKGIPSTYNKDLQESVQPMIESMKTVKDSVLIAARVLATLTVFPEKMLAALSPDMLATDLAEYLVRKGVPFRETHHISGRAVALAEKENIPMDKLTLAQFKGVDERIGDDVLEVFNYERSVELKSAIGGTSKSAVLKQIETLRKSL